MKLILDVLERVIRLRKPGNEVNNMQQRQQCVLLIANTTEIGLNEVKPGIQHRIKLVRSLLNYELTHVLTIHSYS